MLEAYREKVNAKLRSYFKETECDAFLEEFTMRGGKRIRPILAIAGYKCFRNDNRIVTPALATEFLHSALLIHDDIIDESDERRGKPTVHKRFDDDRTGLTAAILSGDLSAHRMYAPIRDSDFTPEQQLEAIDLLRDTAETEVEGEWKDSLHHYTDEEDVLEIYRKKTAAYTTVAPLRLGALLADQPTDTFDAVAENIGIAYQIMDDLNGVFGDETKPSDDIMEGKPSLLYAKTLEKCTEDERDFLLDVYGTDKAMDDVRALFDTYARNYCMLEVEGSLSTAADALHESWRDDGKELLARVIERVREL